jgi:hypothetical protein
MENLRTLVETVKQAKAEYLALQNEHSSTCDRARYDALKPLIADQTNVVYNAVQALNHALRTELGVYASEMGELTQSFGYCGGKNVTVQPIHANAI